MPLSVNPLPNFCNKANEFGYIVNIYKAIEKDGSWYCDLTFKKTDKYLPEIVFDCMDEVFSMQTSTFGALNGDELEKFIVGVNKGKAFMDFLQNFDIRGLMYRVGVNSKITEPNRLIVKGE